MDTKETLIKKLSKFSLTRLNKAQVWESGSCYSGETKESLLEKLFKYYSLSELSRLLELAK